MRTPTTIAASAVLFSIAATASADERPLSEAITDVSALAEIDALFAVRMGATVQGGGTLTSEATLEINTVVDGDTVVMEDELNYGGRTIRHEAVCEARGALRPESGAVSFSKGDRVIESTYVVDGDAQVVLAGGRHHERDMPFGVVTQQALMRIIPMLPREPGGAYTFGAYAESFDQRVSEPLDGETFRVMCMGIEDIRAQDANMPAWRFDVDAGRQWSAWVSAEGELMRIEADGGSTVMERVDEDAFARMTGEYDQD